MTLTPGTEYTMTPTFREAARRTKALTCRVVMREVDDPKWVLIEFCKNGPKNELGDRGRLWWKQDRALRERKKWRFAL